MENLHAMVKVQVVEVAVHLPEELLLSALPRAGHVEKRSAALAELHVLVPSDRVASLRETTNCQEYGYSYIQYPANGLGELGKLVQHRIANAQELTRRWMVGGAEPGTGTMAARVARSYLREVQDFLRMLLVLMRMTDGVPPRGPELVGVRASNGLCARDLYAGQRPLMIVVLYDTRRGGARRRRSSCRPVSSAY
jgi:hypothetical protein